jgi:hypothetical protein
MSTQTVKTSQGKSLDRSDSFVENTGTDWEQADTDWRNLEQSMFTVENIIAMVFIAFVAISIAVILMPPWISDDVEIIYFRVHKAPIVDQPAYITPENISKTGDQSSAQGNGPGHTRFIPPSSAGDHVTGHARFADGMPGDDRAAACARQTRMLACLERIPGTETSRSHGT